MHDFPLELQAKIEVIDPSISYYLRNELELRRLDRWVKQINFKKVELIFIPYNEE